MTELCHRRLCCRLCGSQDLTLVLSLKPTPPANALVAKDELHVPQPCFPLDVFFCETCAHVQLCDVVDPKHLFENYLYVSGTSNAFRAHLQQYAKTIVRDWDPHDGLVIDIGSNDGTLLKYFQDEGCTVLGIDPAKNVAEIANKNGVETIADFFNPDVAKRIKRERGAASVITANNVFAHVDDLSGVAKGVRELLSPNGLFVFEVSYLVDVFEKTLFDTIYHEHIAYHSVKPLISFFDWHDLELVRVERVATQGGSLRGFARPKGHNGQVEDSVVTFVAMEERLGLHSSKTFFGFAERIDKVRDELRALLQEVKSQGGTVAGFGAPAKATTLMHHFEMDTDTLDFIVDDNPLKHGLYTPGKRISVVPPQELERRKPDCVVLLAWNFALPIMHQNTHVFGWGGRFVTPLPNVAVYDKLPVG